MRQIDTIGIKMSAIARRMDQGSFVLETLDIPACFMELSQEKSLSQGKEKYPSYVMNWIGYMYRYIAYTREVSSAFLFSKVKTRQLYGVYEAYHSLDPEAAAVRILEMVELPTEDPERRMKLARKILL